MLQEYGPEARSSALPKLLVPVMTCSCLGPNLAALCAHGVQHARSRDIGSFLRFLPRSAAGTLSSASLAADARRPASAGRLSFRDSSKCSRPHAGGRRPSTLDLDI